MIRKALVGIILVGIKNRTQTGITFRFRISYRTKPRHTHSVLHPAGRTGIHTCRKRTKDSQAGISQRAFGGVTHIGILGINSLDYGKNPQNRNETE
ncbi:hypothetical protein JW935_21305 [candidate division KSB1 bacterium]|nr:hypothetical protein [candidate division KSB1 bacterium]